MRQAKNNSIVHKIQLKWTKKSADKVAKQQIFIKKNIRLKAPIPANEEVNFLYGNNLPKDLLRKQKISCKLRSQVMIPTT